MLTYIKVSEDSYLAELSAEASDTSNGATDKDSITLTLPKDSDADILSQWALLRQTFGSIKASQPAMNTTDGDEL